MEFTTHFELHSQATRLWGKSRRSAATALRAYHPLWAVAPVKVDLGGRMPRREVAPPNTTFRATRRAGGSVMGSARFIRHYSGHHGCFLFLRLLICLNLAGHLACSQVVSLCTRGTDSKARGAVRPFSPRTAGQLPVGRAGKTPGRGTEESPRSPDRRLIGRQPEGRGAKFGDAPGQGNRRLPVCRPSEREPSAV